jgi:hypothetical protein
MNSAQLNTAFATESLTADRAKTKASKELKKRSTMFFTSDPDVLLGQATGRSNALLGRSEAMTDVRK